jgi:hypothetical protein
MAYITVDVDVSIDEFDDDELISELASRFKNLSNKNKDKVREMFDLMCDELDIDIITFIKEYSTLTIIQADALEDFITNKL